MLNNALLHQVGYHDGVPCTRKGLQGMSSHHFAFVWWEIVAGESKVPFALFTYMCCHVHYLALTQPINVEEWVGKTS